MAESTFLKNHFLIAMPTLADPNFFHTVTYICEHNNQGAMGIVINQPVDLTLSDVIEHLELPYREGAHMKQTIYRGGPVDVERGFVLHRPLGHWDATLEITKTMGLSTSNDIVEAMAQGAGPSQSLIALGYAGWGAGQLEQEIAENSWLSAPASEDVIFDTTAEKRWEAAAALMGIDIKQLTGEFGHA